MKIQELKELLELISERNITEFELEEEGVKLRIKKALTHPPEGAAPAAASPGSPSVTMAALNPSPVEAESTEDGLCYVTSPMVGTFYRQPEPGADPFVREGDFVKKGQVLCIIEAMKLMNEIESEYQGALVKVFVENGQAVQYGDRLLAIREA